MRPLDPLPLRGRQWNLRGSRRKKTGVCNVERLPTEIAISEVEEV
jgi:hypothetical protein